MFPTGKRTLLMGVLNVTPDSFSDGGRFADTASALRRAEKMIEEGADIIDIGGESSRPGAERISGEEELARVLPVVKAIKRSFKVLVSVDTCKGSVAREALASGADIVNDITAFGYDADMPAIISSFGAGAVLMHMRGEPSTMQRSPEYKDIIAEIYAFLEKAVNTAERAGIPPGKIIVDPGIGFGKTGEHNLEIIRSLKEFKKLGKPLLIGTSRKSFLGEVTGKDVSGRVFGTAASVAACVMNGADIVRVHDVAEMKDVALVIDAIKGRTDK
jgi:dihydropteroate synthase